MMQNCNLTVKSETENKLEFKGMQITNTIIWQFVTVLGFGKLVANSYVFVWSHLYILV